MSIYSIENCEVVKDTGKAILVESPELEEPLWVPQSQVHPDSEIWEEGQKGTLVISEWFAEKAGLL